MVSLLMAEHWVQKTYTENHLGLTYIVRSSTLSSFTSCKKFGVIFKQKSLSKDR